MFQNLYSFKHASKIAMLEIYKQNCNLQTYEMKDLFECWQVMSEEK